MAISVADYLIHRLHAWGVTRIYGYPGDGISGIMGALDRFDRIRFIQARHEEYAAMMAAAHGKFTGQVGVTLATSGPGAIHLLNGLYDAAMDHVPVLAIMGQAPRAALGSGYTQEVDLTTLLKDVAHAYVQQVSVPAQLRHVLDTAFRIAQAQRTVTAIIIPADLQQEDAADPKRKHGNTFSGIGYSAPQVVPRDADLQRAADLLNAGERVAMLIGAGALGATPEVIATAEVLGAGIAKAILGKAVVPDDHPFCTGSIGLLGTRPSFDMMAGCDTLLMVGSTLPYSEFLPPEGKVRGVQIDIDPKALSLRYPMDVNLHGDASLTLRALLPYLRPKGESDWTRTIRRNIGEWWELMDRMAYVEAKPLNPRQVLWEGSPRLPDGAIVAADSGTAAYWYAQNFKLRAGQMGSLSGNLATMGNAVPYAIAAKFCYPDRPALAIVGDGAMQMAGLNELITIAKYWREWADPRLVILVLNNRDLNLVTWEQRVLTGDPKYDAAQNIPNFPYARYAADLGLTGIVVDQPHGVAGAWEAAWSAGRPVVLEAIVDPTVPPLPPHITFDQAVKFFKAVVKGDPQRGEIVKQSVKQLVETMKG